VDTAQRAFDALNRLYQITDPASGITATSYDAHNRPLTVTAPTGVATAYVYDGFGDVIQESNPNTGTAVYYYDSTGNRIERVAATGAVTQYTYDALNRVLTMTFPSDSAENVAYTYDESGHGTGIGRLTSVADAAGTLSRSYDQLGNLLTDARTSGTVNLTTTYAYDPANRVASITYPSGAAVVYTRDTMGRVTSVSAQPSGGASTLVASSIAYKPFGPDAGLHYGSSGQQTRTFDQDYRLTNVTDLGTVRRGLARVAENLSYAYYPTNNVQAITDAVTSANSQSFSYDNLQRLSNASGGYGGFGFTYDGDGNQLSQTHGSTTTNYGYGSGSDLLATISVGGVQTQAIGYTADGRIASLSPGIQAPGGQTITSLSYSQDARLSAVNASGGALASYTYDGFGQRLIKTVSASYGEIYQYGQDGMLLEETNATGVAQADYVYLNGRPVAVLNGSTVYYLHDDTLGTPQSATDSNQNIAWQAMYQPFGQASVSGTVTQNLRLPGQYFDVESGWNHNGFRDYLPALGRYAEPDPLGRAGSGNTLYAYAFDSPINVIDPYGLSGWLTIYASGSYGTGASGYFGNHAWISYTPDGGSTTTYGTWGNNPLGLANGLETNLPYDMEHPYDASRSAYLNDAQQAALMNYINRVHNQGANGWSLARPCSHFASTAWQAGTGEWLPDGSPTMPSSPAGLVQSINAANAISAGNPSTPQLMQWMWSHMLFF
jgi:RHS repeat-associated protein